ncbi:sulfate transporter family-domain-containing protein [Cokeromyces recurvatus]|uniref:sulfate transporter family-domain-containing protein n=1 Tax=Cokeromyces recurvatus TaxID=90255 RepID=UPI00221F605A|nr:sulfate transporter family-domain-containing protein [Cokeromyces recurvatus]KAI7907534.1 sulfate transporter family-domain-containing protein [Cokeromyces recurvatus]
MRLFSVTNITLAYKYYSRWIKIISVLLIGLRAADWPYELAFHTIQQHIIKEAPQSGSQCWAVWGEGVIILNFVGDALANLFLSGMFVRRLFIHIHTSKSLISYRNETIERIAQKSLICLAFTFLVNLAMNLLKITMFIGEHSDAFTVYFEIIESTLLVEALRNDGYQSTHHTSQCASCQKELNQDINTKRGLDTTNCLNSQAFLRSFHNIDNKQNKHYSAYTLDTYDENRIRHVVSSTEPVLISDKNYSSFTSSIQLNEGPSNTSRTQNQSMLTLMEDPPTHNKLIPQYNTNIDKLSSPRLSSSIITSVPIAGDTVNPRINYQVFYVKDLYILIEDFPDVVAGVTVGIVAVPQGMGYAKIANLPPQYGLYSSFVGLCLYCLFGTSKDISIGPTAVMSLLVGQTISKVTMTGDFTGPQVALTLALFGGFIALFLGLVRLGILVDFIPGPAIAGFMTGSSITISIGQWPKLFGISSVNTHDSAYLVFGNFFKHLPETQLDAAFGLMGLLWLYTVRWGTNCLTKRYPKYEKIFFFANIMRNGLLVIFSTLIAFLININRSSSPIHILKDVPSGFTAMNVPKIDVKLLSQLSSTLPSVIIILILEHIAIAKSFGRINNYKIDADQEIIAIGATNVIGSFFGAYSNTGSFSRTAITARSGARTPLNGVFAALVVLLCLYVLTPAFYYIPDATLSAIIIHAVADLVSGPTFLRQVFRVNPFELFTFIAAVAITFFTTVEYGIYISVALSIIFMLLRIARPRYAVLGRIPVQSSTADCHLNNPNGNEGYDFNLVGKSSSRHEENSSRHYIYVRQDHQTLSHLVEPPPDGLVIFRFDESLTYPNAGFISDKIMHYIQDNFNSGASIPRTKGEQAWNDRRSIVVKKASKKKNQRRIARGENEEEELKELPRLHAIVLDCSAINHLDSTGVQTLLDLKLSINRYVGNEVEWHFASIASPAIRNALITGGFGSQAGRGPRTGELLPVIPVHQDGPQYNVNDRKSPMSCQKSPLGSLDNECSESVTSCTNEKIVKSAIDLSIISKTSSVTSTQVQYEVTESVQHPIASVSNCSRMSCVINMDGDEYIEYHPQLDRGLPIDRYPFFHWDLEDAVRAASYTRKKSSNSS